MLMQRANFIIYQAYGHEDILREALYSMFSLFETSSTWIRDNVTIVIYTDQTQWFMSWLDQTSYNVKFEKITPEQLKEWRGDIDFVHRVKIKILQDFFNKYSGNTLYLDTDTSFLAEVQPLFESIDEGKIYMHTLEGRISTKKNPIFKKLYAFLQQSKFQVGDQLTKISVDTEMWNAGVIGLNERNANLLNEVLALTDEMYKHYAKHVIEQLAFSYILRKQNDIVAAENVVFHYWNFKEFRQVLVSFFEYAKGKSFAETVELSNKIKPSELIKPKLNRKKAFFLVKFWKKITRQKEQIPIINFKNL